MPVISVLGRVRQEDFESRLQSKFEVSLGCQANQTTDKQKGIIRKK